MPYIASGLFSIDTGGSTPALAGVQRRSKIWSYLTADSKATLEGAGYFNSIAADLQIGDVILAVTGITASAAVCRMYVVSNNTGTVVTITKSEIA